MRRWDDEALMAYVHGELDHVSAKRIEAEMAVDPALARRVRFLRNARRALITVYEATARQPIPDAWRRMLEALEDRDLPGQSSTTSETKRKPS